MPEVRRTLVLTGVAIAVVPGCLAVPLIVHRLFGNRHVPLVVVMPFLVPITAVLVFAGLLRIRHGMPSPRIAFLLLAVQSVMAVAAADVLAGAEFTGLIAACTALIVLPVPWSWVCFFVFRAVQILVLAGDGPSWSTAALFAYSLVVGLAVFVTMLMAELALALSRTKAQLADVAVAGERSRVSRDLHDTLGQEITAVGLRAELAARLVTVDPAAAVEHMTAIQRMTEQAMSHVRQVASGMWQPTFATELERGVAVLRKSRVHCDVRINAMPEARIEQAAGWALREAVTNVLRHSTAHRCVVTTDEIDDEFRLVVENDGVRTASASSGSGLAGLADRIREIDGRIEAIPRRGKRYRLTVEIPLRTGEGARP